MNDDFKFDWDLIGCTIEIIVGVVIILTLIGVPLLIIGHFVIKFW